MMKHFALALFLAFTARAQPPYTLISDTLPPGANGTTVTGTVNISWTEFTYGSYTVAQSPANGVNFPVTNGAVNIRLVPTDQAGAPVTYKVVTTIGRSAVTTYWQVPTLPSGQCASTASCKVKEVTVVFPAAPSTIINPSQISTAGSSPGQALCNINGTMGFCNGGTGPTSTFVFEQTPVGIIDGINSIFTLASAPNPASSLALFRNGILLEAGNIDYALSGTTITFVAAAIPQPGDILQAWYSAGGAIDAAGYCNTPGTFDETCITNAVAALPAAGGAVLLGNASYTLGATVSIANETRITLYGPGATITAANGLNGDLLYFNNCQRCRVIGVEVNGNGANQTGTSHGIVFEDSAYSIVEDAYIHGCLTSGVYLYYDGVGSTADEIKVITSYIQNNLGIGVLVNSVNDSLIAMNHIDYNAGAAGVEIENAHNNVVFGNNLLSNTGHGIFVYGGKRNDTSRNQVRNNNQDGIVYQMTAESIIDGNTAHINGQGMAGAYSGIVCDTCTNVVIANNVSLDTDFPPMHQAYGLQVLGSSTNLTVSNNVLAPNLDGAASLVGGAVISALGNVGLVDIDQNQVAEPANSSSPCTPGQYAVSAAYRYECVATNTWVRGALASW